MTSQPQQAPSEADPRRRALRDAWLAEMWPVVPEYRLGHRPRPYRSAR